LFTFIETFLVSFFQVLVLTSIGITHFNGSTPPSNMRKTMTVTI